MELYRFWNLIFAFGFFEFRFWILESDGIWILELWIWILGYILILEFGIWDISFEELDSGLETVFFDFGHFGFGFWNSDDLE